jgi:hypothetical protein
MSLTDHLADESHVEFGFCIMIFVLSIMWNSNWRHYIRYWIRSNPPYKRSTMIVMRSFFALSFVGTAWQLIDELIEQRFALLDYGLSLLDALIMLTLLGALDLLFRWKWGPPTT